MKQNQKPTQKSDKNHIKLYWNIHGVSESANMKFKCFNKFCIFYNKIFQKYNLPANQSACNVVLQNILCFFIAIRYDFHLKSRITVTTTKYYSCHRLLHCSHVIHVIIKILLLITILHLPYAQAMQLCHVKISSRYDVCHMT